MFKPSLAYEDLLIDRHLHLLRYSVRDLLIHPLQESAQLAR